MKRKKSVYVQTEIETNIDELWKYTQDPKLHTEWDARFTEISYLERQEGEPQRFLYKTKIGFGIEISGEGESVGDMQKETGERISSLKFWTKHPLSLIHTGRGYWKYTPIERKVNFETQYDYDVNFGTVGRFIDTYVFRPVLGWATAWSFDALKFWLEKGLHPRLLLRRAVTYWLVCLLLSFVWIYQGLIPKVIFMYEEEVRMLSTLIGSNSYAKETLKVIGLLEIVFGVIWLLPFQKRRLFLLHIIIILALTIAAWITNMNSFLEPFNPATLNVVLIGLSIVGYMNSSNLPRAKQCRKSRKRE